MLQVLKNEAKREFNKRIIEFKETVKNCNSFEGIDKHWYLNQFLTKTIKNKIYTNSIKLSDLKKILIEKKQKQVLKQLNERFLELENICNSELPEKINVSIEWRKNRTWGANPTAYVEIKTANSWNRFSSGSIGGCGYDKESTAFSNACNQSFSIQKLLLKNRKKLEKLNVYGQRNGSLSGGVGVSCYYHIFEVCGYKMTQVANGNTFNVYQITKK